MLKGTNRANEMQHYKPPPMRISRGIPLLEYEVNYIAARIQSCYEQLQQEYLMQKQYHEGINQILRNASQNFLMQPKFFGW